MRNREAWLQRGMAALRREFRAVGIVIPADLRASCGWPGLGPAPQQDDAEYWPPSRSTGGYGEIFISPKHDDSVRVLADLVHEMIHHLHRDTAQWHGPEFKRAARAIGLKPGNPSAHTEPTRRLREKLHAIIEAIGPYPHSRIRP